nr:head-tail adaptor protein [Pseudooceanicola algae]
MLEVSQDVPDGSGGYQQVWSTLGMLWAEVLPGAGSTVSRGGIAAQVQKYKVTVRSAPVGASSRPVPGQRFRDEIQTLVIETVADRDPQGRFLICQAREELYL